MPLNAGRLRFSLESEIAGLESSHSDCSDCKESAFSKQCWHLFFDPEVCEAPWLPLDGVEQAPCSLPLCHSPSRENITLYLDLVSRILNNRIIEANWNHKNANLVCFQSKICHHRLRFLVYFCSLEVEHSNRFLKDQ